MAQFSTQTVSAALETLILEYSAESLFTTSDIKCCLKYNNNLLSIFDGKSNAKRSSPTRPTFYTDSHKPIRAGGVLFINPQKGWLMQKHREKKGKGKYIYVDFGGKTEYCDNSIQDCISRETLEESNEHIDNINWEKAEYYYNDTSKYLLSVIHVPTSFVPDPTVMGDVETFTSIQRTVQWINPENITNKDIHIRIRWYLNKKQRKGKKTSM